MSDSPTSDPVDTKTEVTKAHVESIIQDYNQGLISRKDTIRIRDRSNKALGDMDLVGGIGRMTG